MPQVTLYVKDSDQPVWESARSLAAARGESLSALVTTALELVAGRRDARPAPRGEMAPVELVGWDFRNRDVPRTLRFTGVKVAQVGTLSAYLTRAQKIILEEWELLDERYVAVFDSYEALQAHPVAQALDSRLLADIAAAVGTPFVETIE
ncbi:hypothetical protein TBR22_A29010 [Luteitalea sp. TBR-22]|uniref:hypothetical protein n=1 Tax=Luteitalea sp. TBR-22 TaxID=2802971 RepID=UPI001AF94A9C|nr:hypothetical protein [Luteitalea sp. TBR-22]BCS33674.1 hypothetical protein TBR22_A29010 [Luteitalea sp. TBR-22]